MNYPPSAETSRQLQFLRHHGNDFNVNQVVLITRLHQKQCDTLLTLICAQFSCWRINTEAVMVMK